MRTSMLRGVFRPFDFDDEVRREEAPRFLALSASLGFAFAVPGLVIGWLLTEAEQRAWGSVLDPGSRYLSFAKVFFAPAFFGLLMVFSGIFKSLQAYFPWLASTSTLPWLVRMALGVVLGSLVGLAGLWMFLLVMTR